MANHSNGAIEEGLGKLLEFILNMDKGSLRERANQLKEQHPDETPEQLAHRVIGRDRWWGVGYGFATGLPSNIFAMLPAAAADARFTFKKDVSLTATIALLFDPTCLDGEEPPYELLVPILGLQPASQFLRALAVSGGMGVTRVVIRNCLSKETLALFKKIMLKHFTMKVTQRAVIEKSLPTVGGVVGAEWNYAEIHLVGRRAIQYFVGGTMPNVAPPSSSNPFSFGPEPDHSV